MIELEGEELDVVWEIHRFNRERQELQEKIRRNEVVEMIKDLPPGLLDKLPEPLQKKLKTDVSQIT